MFHCTLVWRTFITGSTSVATFGPSAMVGDNDTDSGFTAVLTERTNGVFISTLTFNPSTVSAAGSSGVNVICEDFFLLMLLVQLALLLHLQVCM